MPKKNLDTDIEIMTVAELKRQVKLLRRHLRKERDEPGNRRCWDMEGLLPEGGTIRPIELPECVFLRNCKRWYRRNQPPLRKRRSEKQGVKNERI